MTTGRFFVSTATFPVLPNVTRDDDRIFVLHSAYDVDDISHRTWTRYFTGCHPGLDPGSSPRLTVTYPRQAVGHQTRRGE